MEDYFPGVSQEHLLRRVSEGKLNLPSCGSTPARSLQGGRIDRLRSLPRPANEAARKDAASSASSHELQRRSNP